MTASGTRSMTEGPINVDKETVASFGDEWTHFDQSKLSVADLDGGFAVSYVTAKIAIWRRTTRSGRLH